MTQPNVPLQTNSATSRARRFDSRTHADSNVVLESLRSGDRLAPACPSKDLSAKAFADQIRNLHKKRPAIATKARFELARERVKAITANVIIVAKVERGSGIGRVTKQQLATNVRIERVIVSARAQKDKARELISRAK